MHKLEGRSHDVFEQSSDRMRAPPNRVRQHSPGADPQPSAIDWRAEMESTRRCSVVGCDREFAARSMCLKHYKRARTAAAPADRFSLATFDSHLNHDGPIQPHRPDLGACWEWSGPKNSAGYGIMPAKRFGTTLAHRAALALEIGRPVDGLAMHLCDNPPCCRPSHLREGTHADNSADAVSKGRTRGGRYDQTHCIRGHELTESNIKRVVRSDGYNERRCISCKREDSKKMAERRKAARHERGLLRGKAK